MSKPNVKARRKRLLVLADFLEGTVLPMLDGAKFNMGEWGAAASLSDDIPQSIGETSECGFAACAAGWGYYCPSLVRQGIRNKVVELVDSGIGQHLDSDYWRLAVFFGISHDEAHRCFGSDTYGWTQTPLTGRRGIRRVVARLRKIAAVEPPSEVAP